MWYLVFKSMGLVAVVQYTPETHDSLIKAELPRRLLWEQSAYEALECALQFPLDTPTAS